MDQINKYLIKQYKYKLSDILVLIIIFYIIAEIIVTLYKFFKGEEHKIEDISYKNKRLESFSQDSINESLDSLNNRLYLTFPGEYKESIYRPATINSTIKKMIEYLINPIINHLNSDEGTHFNQIEITYIVIREYKDGVIYHIKFFIIDPFQSITRSLKLELVINNQGLYHINHIGLAILDSNIKPGISIHTKFNNLAKYKKPIYKNEGDKIKNLKMTILPKE